MFGKKHNLIQQAITVSSLMFIAFVVVFYTPEQAHAAPWLGEPIYQVLSNTSSGMGKITADVWTVTMNVVNSFVLALLIYVAFMNILRIQMDSYAVKKFLPTFIMTIILANFSFLIARIIIDLGNIVISIFLAGNQQNALSGAFDKLIVCDNPGDLGCPIAPDKVEPGANYYAVINAYIFKQFFVIAGAIMMFILSFVFLVRNYMLYFLIAIAPLGFLAMALPITKKYFQQWWGTFTKWVFMPVVSVFWLWLGGQFVSAVDTGYWILPVAFGGLCLYMAITSPFKIGGAVLGAWGKLGKQAWGATGGKATKWAGQEAKERAGATALRARLAVARTTPYKKVLGDDSAFGKYRSKVRANTARRKLFLEGPELAKKKREENARVDAAYDLTMDDRTPSELKSRYKALIRNWSQDDRKGKENRGLQDLLDSLKFNPDGTVVTSNNNQGVIDPKKRFTEKGGLGDQASTLAQIAYLLRRPNTLDTTERTIANNINSGSPVTVNGAPTVLQFRNMETGAAVQDLRKLDANAFGTSPVPVVDSQAAAPSAPGSSPAEEEISRSMKELLEEFRGMENAMGGEGSLGGEGGYDQLLGEIYKMKPNLTLSDAGLAAAILPVMKVRIESMDPTALEQWGRKIRQVSEGVNKMNAGIEAENASVLRQIATVIRNGANPSKLAEGRQAIGEAANSDKDI